MKIAIVSPRYPADGAVGGCETLLASLAHYAANLPEAGHEVHFLTTCATNHFSWDNEKEPGVERIDNVDVHYFRVDEDRDIELFLRVQGLIDEYRPIVMADQKAWIRNSVNSRDLIAHLRASEYDAVVVGPYLFGITHAVAEAVPERTYLVPCLHDESYAQLNLMREMFHRVRGLLFNAEPERQLAIRLYDLPEGTGNVVGMGMPGFPSDGDAFIAKQGFEHPYLIYCGRREPGKGTPLMLDYLELFRQRTGRDFHLVLTGSGEVHPGSELAPLVRDLGYVDEQTKRDAMAGALAFVHPSVNESFGIVLLEAWLAGTPGLVHGKSDVLRDQCRRANGGLWFTHYPDFEAMLLWLMDNREQAAKLGAFGKAYVEREYSWDSVGRRFFEALDA